MLADIKVVRFDFLLGVLDRAAHPRMLERDVFFEPELIHQASDRSATETPHQLVFKRHEEARRTRITLATSATAQLIVDAPRLVPLGAEHVQPAQQANPVSIPFT